MTELVVNLLSSQHGSHTLRKERDGGRLERKDMKQREIKLEKERGQAKIDWTRE